MTEELHEPQLTSEETVDETANGAPSPLADSIHKLKEVSQIVTKLGEDLKMLVSSLEELTTLMQLVGGFKTQSAQGALGPLMMLSSLMAKGREKSDTEVEEGETGPGLDMNQLLMTLLSQQLGKHR